MARTFKGLYGRICSFENLLSAWRNAARGKRHKPDVAVFELGLEGELLSLGRELSERTYRPGPFRRFVAHESKDRAICVAPFRDRVVHHALIDVIGPLLERSFICDSYANRKEKGTHRAILRCSRFCRESAYVLKCDIAGFFESVDRGILLSMLERRIRDEGVLWLAGRILGVPVDSGACRPAGPAEAVPCGHSRGLPIGNLTSQFFANLYLDGMDHFVKERLRCARYLRYVDDFAVFDDSKARLAGVRDAIGGHLAGIGLSLHPGKTQIYPVEQGCDFLGFKVFPCHRRLRRGAFLHFSRRYRKMARRLREGSIRVADITRTVQAWVAHASWGDTWGLRRKLFSEVRA